MRMFQLFRTANETFVDVEIRGPDIIAEMQCFAAETILNDLT